MTLLFPGFFQQAGIFAGSVNLEVEILYRYFFERLYLLAAGEHVIRKP